MLPSPARMCHRTGFEKSCRKLVAEGHCERWASHDLIHPITKVQAKESGCADDLSLLMLMRINNAQIETTASVDKTHNAAEAAEKINSANVQALGRLATAMGAIVDVVERAPALSAPATKLIEAHQ